MRKNNTNIYSHPGNVCRLKIITLNGSMESRIYIFSDRLLRPSNTKHYFSFSAFFMLSFRCELFDYGWFRKENEKLQTEKFNPSMKLAGWVGVCSEWQCKSEAAERNYCWRFMTFLNEER